MRKQILLVGLCLLTACAHTKPAAEITETEPQPIKSVDVVKATPQETTIAPGESGVVPVRLQIKNGYHVNANPPSQSYLKATEIELKAAEGIGVESITYPDPLLKTFAFSETPLKVYEGETELKIHLKADKSASPGKHNLSAKLRVQACDDKVCYAPGAMDLTVPVNVK
ncbi:MAG TPA: protein-disulfide reductase DsbD domain-containing protein [Pyrinomonadaceae bacterium]|nr:protein-disulfide reductase DsbD domain-containing protein [Pyrinomonadaceae bacterium]